MRIPYTVRSLGYWLRTRLRGDEATTLRECVSSVRLREEDGRYFGLSHWSDGAISLEVQDLNPPPELGMSEYEYGFTVGAQHMPSMLAALGGNDRSIPDDDLGPQTFAFVKEHADELIEYGRAAREPGGEPGTPKGPGLGPGGWLEDHGVEYEFWNRVSPA